MIVALALLKLSNYPKLLRNIKVFLSNSPKLLINTKVFQKKSYKPPKKSYKPPRENITIIKNISIAIYIFSVIAFGIFFYSKIKFCKINFTFVKKIYIVNMNFGYRKIL
jgi:hypothetical protein